MPRYDAVVVTDYGHGMLTPEIIELLCSQPRFLAVNTQTNAANRDYAQPVYEALDGPLTAESSGFVGTADDSIDSTNTDAVDGNVVQHARVQLADDGSALLALGFGATQNEAVGTAEGSIAGGFDEAFHEYKEGWKHYDNLLNKPPQKLKGLQANADTEERLAGVLRAPIEHPAVVELVADLEPDQPSFGRQLLQ